MATLTGLGGPSWHSCCASCSRARSRSSCCSWRRCRLRTRCRSAPRTASSLASGCWARTPGCCPAGAGGGGRGVRNTVVVASGAPDADPSTTRGTGPGAETETAGPGDRGVPSGGEGGTTGFSVLRELCCLWKTRHGMGSIRARLQGVLPLGEARPLGGTSLRAEDQAAGQSQETQKRRAGDQTPRISSRWGRCAQTPAVGPPFTHLSRG